MIRPSSLRAAGAFLALALLTPFVPSCKDEPATGIMLAISSEASIPKDIDSISLQVQRGSTTTFARSYAVDASGQAHIPGSLTFELHPDEEASDPIHIVMKADQKGEQVSLRSATMSFIKGKTKLLRMELRFSCIDFPKACGDGETCLGGKCQRDFVDVNTLPEAPVTVEHLFPTATEGGCFDASDEKCAASRQQIDDLAAFATADCAFTLPSSATGAKLNLFGIWTSQSDQGHPVVIENDALEGWTFKDDAHTTFQLTEGLCDQFKSGQLKKVEYNLACDTKDPAQTVCIPDSLPPQLPFETDECNKCTYKDVCVSEFNEVMAKEPASAALLTAAFACTFDGVYSSEDECDAVRGCFLGNLLPILNCDPADCDKTFHYGRIWTTCVADAYAQQQGACAAACGGLKKICAPEATP